MADNPDQAPNYDGVKSGKATTRAQYEELRQPSTPLVRRRALLDAMTQAWEDIPVPLGGLLEENLHEHEQIRKKKRP